MSKHKDLKLHQYWFKTWWGLLLLAIAFPTLWWAEALYFAFLIYKRKEYQFTNTNIAIGASLLLAFPVIVLTATGFIIAGQYSTIEIEMLIDEGKFTEAQEKVKNTSNEELKVELAKLDKDNIYYELIKVIRDNPESQYEAAIKEGEYSSNPKIEEEIEKQMIEKLDEAPQLKEGLQILTEAKINEIEELIRQINNNEYKIADIPYLIIQIPEDNPDLLTYRDRLIQAGRNFQSRKFPELRQSQAEALSDALWVDNYEVYTYGPGNSTIVFKNVIFANNRNIQDFQSIYSEILKEFRYDRVEYKWSTYGDYSYFDLDSKADTFINGIDEEV